MYALTIVSLNPILETQYQGSHFLIAEVSESDLHISVLIVIELLPLCYIPPQLKPHNSLRCSGIFAYDRPPNAVLPAPRSLPSLVPSKPLPDAGVTAQTFSSCAASV
jgi:hypothetical protein